MAEAKIRLPRNLQRQCRAVEYFRDTAQLNVVLQPRIVGQFCYTLVHTGSRYPTEMVNITYGPGSIHYASRGRQQAVGVVVFPTWIGEYWRMYRRYSLASYSAGTLWCRVLSASQKQFQVFRGKMCMLSRVSVMLYLEAVVGGKLRFLFGRPVDFKHCVFHRDFCFLSWNYCSIFYDYNSFGC